MSLIAPNRVNIAVQHLPGPLATPFLHGVVRPGELSILAVGGITQRLATAAPIAAALAARDDLSYDAIAERALQIADRLIAQCGPETAGPLTEPEPRAP